MEILTLEILRDSSNCIFNVYIIKLIPNSGLGLPNIEAKANKIILN